jgi:hypothetical protein
MLADAMFDFSLAAGLRPSYRALERGGPRKRTTYTLHFTAGQESRVVDGEVFYRVANRFRDRLSVPVYNLEVAGEHTYVAELVGVHNCLKGYDEYAFVSNFRPRPPAQAVWVVTPEHGITFNTRVFVADRRAEGW